jgi:hypothetical protein
MSPTIQINTGLNTIQDKMLILIKEHVPNFYLETNKESVGGCRFMYLPPSHSHSHPHP